MIVLISDYIDEIGILLLKEKGFEVKYLPTISKDELIEEIKNVDALIVRGRTKVTKEIIDNAKNLKIIVRAGVGLDNIDVNYANEKGILVKNTPAAPSIAVAELTIGLMLSLLREIPKANFSLKRGEWIKSKLIGNQLSGKVIGIVGFGRIGYEVAKRLVNFNCKIIAYDIDPSREIFAKELGIEFTMNFEYVLKNADIITIHVPLLESTRKMFSYETFSKMKKGVYLINTSRGEVIDEDALLEFLLKGHIAGVALDVFSNEPPSTETEKKILSLDNVISTPHIGAQTKESLYLESKEAAEIIINFFKNK